MYDIVYVIVCACICCRLKRIPVDWDDGKDPHFFGQRIPPLYVQIKDILQEYPDGQIFKVQSLVAIASGFYKKLHVQAAEFI